MGSPCQPAWSKWPGPARAPTPPPDTEVTLLTDIAPWPLQTAVSVTLALGEQLEEKAGTVG